MNPISPVLMQDIVSEVFSYLPSLDVLSVARVCKLWNKIANNEGMWKRYYVRLVSTEFASQPCPYSTYKEAFKELTQIIEAYPTSLIVALDSTEKILKLPSLCSPEPKTVVQQTVATPELWFEITTYALLRLNLEEISAPVMRGKAKDSEHFCILKVKEFSTEKSTILCFFQTSPHATLWSYQESNDDGSYSQIQTCQDHHFEQITQIRAGTHPRFQLLK